MADKIDQLRINNVDYDISLPAYAEEDIVSLKAKEFYVAVHDGQGSITKTCKIVYDETSNAVKFVFS